MPSLHGCWKSVTGLLLGDVLFHFPSFCLLQALITLGSPGVLFSQVPLHPSSYVPQDGCRMQFGGRLQNLQAALDPEAEGIVLAFAV